MRICTHADAVLDLSEKDHHAAALSFKITGLSSYASSRNASVSTQNVLSKTTASSCLSALATLKAQEAEEFIPAWEGGCDLQPA